MSIAVQWVLNDHVTPILMPRSSSGVIAQPLFQRRGCVEDETLFVQRLDDLHDAFEE
jgi:hypothetical protein